MTSQADIPSDISSDQDETYEGSLCDDGYVYDQNFEDIFKVYS